MVARSLGATWVILVQGMNFRCEPVVLGSPGSPGVCEPPAHSPQATRLQRPRGWAGIFTITSPESVA